MSSYKKLTKNPETKQFELATWIDNYFGEHNYGIIFDSSPNVVFDPRDEPLETKDMASTGITNAVGYAIPEGTEIINDYLKDNHERN